MKTLTHFQNFAFHRLSLFVCLTFLAMTAKTQTGVDVVSSSENELRVKVTIQPVRFLDQKLTDGNIYKVIDAPPSGEMDIGTPDMPVFGNWILIPNGKDILIQVEKGKPVMYENISLPPVQPPDDDITTKSGNQITRNEFVYATDTDFPGVFATTEPVKYNRGQPCTILWVYPYQYNPVKKILTVYPDLEVTVQFTGTGLPVPSNLKNRTNDEMMKSIALNGQVVLSAQTRVKSMDGKSGKMGCEMLIITHPNFKNAADVLAQYRNRRGISTLVWDTITTDPFVIKDYINDAVSTWDPAPYYLLLIGDADYVPTWHVNNHYNIDERPNQGRVGTDFFYADNEYQSTSNTDYVPDFSIGRLSVETQAQADSLVNRIIRYETAPPSSDWYFYTAVVPSYFQDDNNDSIDDRRFVKTCEDVKNFLENNNPVKVVNRVYTTNSTWPKYWSNDTRYKMGNDTLKGEIPELLQRPNFAWNGNGNDIKVKINDGRFFVVHRDHGARNGWDNPEFRSGDVDALNNGEKRPIVWSINCQTGWFDNETDDNVCNTGTTDECFAEHWLRHSTGGSCGVFGATRVSPSSMNNYFVWGLMDAVWPGFIESKSGSFGDSDAFYRLGDIMKHGKSYLTSRYEKSSDTSTIKAYRSEIEMYHCFGDPSMEMWTDEPENITSVDATDAIVSGANKISVTVTTGDPESEDFFVSVYSEDEKRIYGTGFTDEDGIAVIALDTTVAENENLRLMASKHNFIPKSKNITVGAGESGFITADRTWSADTIKVVGNITVEEDVTLTVEEGVYVQFMGHYHIQVYGQMLAEGTKDDTITFSPKNTTTGWHGIRFFDTDPNSQSASKLQFCKLEYGKAEYLVYTNQGDGGAVLCKNSSGVVIENCLIKNNKAFSGGGIYCNNSDITIKYTTIKDNESGIGGGITCTDGASPEIYDVLINNNSATQKGGGLLCYLKSSPGLTKVIIENNTAAQHGGGVYLEGYITDCPEPVFDSVTIRNNEAIEWGGGMYSAIRAWPKMSHSIIISNFAGKYGGGVACNYSWPDLTNVTLSANAADSSGGGIYSYNQSGIDLKNCILWDNTPQEIVKATNGGNPTITYSDIEGSYTGTGNINSDPLFYAISGDSAYYLTQSSPCLDAGDPLSPHDPDGSRADMGAYYYHQQPVTPFPPTANFEADTTYGYYPWTITFTDLSQKGTGDIKKWKWDFGDNSTDTLQNPLHTYTNDGCYSVSLIVTDANNLTDTLIKTNYITIVAAPPVADFSADSTEWYKPFKVDFTDESLDGSGGIDTWSWDFGDLGTSSSQNPSHTYLAEGSYTVSLTVTDINDSTDTRVKTDYITVLPGTYIPGGFVSGTWSLANSPYVIGGEITLHSDSALTIDPGVEVLFLKHYKFVVNGQLSAQGTQTDSIVFTSKDIWEGWHGLRFINSANSVLAYCKIMYGRANGTGSVQDSCGGGIYCESSFIEINHCLLGQNIAYKHGGGLYCDNTPAQITTTRFDNNVAFESGGGIYSFNSGLIVTGDTLVNNEAGLGGGIYTEGNPFPSLLASLIDNNLAFDAGGGIYIRNFGNINVQQTTISENTTGGSGGGIYLGGNVTPSFMDVPIVRNNGANGGGVYFEGTSFPSFSNVNISNNGAGNGGGIYFSSFTNPGFVLSNLPVVINSAAHGGGIYFEASSGPSLVGCHILDNTANGENAFGGGIYCNQSGPNLSNCLIRSNSVFSYQVAGGGGMYLYNSSNPNIFNCQINNNTTYGKQSTSGGGITCDATSNPFITYSTLCGNTISCETNPPLGAGMYCAGNSDPVLEKVTLSGNNAVNGAGGGIYSNGNGTNPGLKNSISWDNLPQEIALASNGTLTATWSDIEGGWAGLGNKNLDPLFENAPAWNFHLTWPNYPVPGAKSPCIDSGDPASPPDPDGTRADMGAFYFDQTILPVAFDFGDCHDPAFATLLASNGARHLINPNVYLGYFIDSENDGQPDEEAKGDDNDGCDDDDGVVFQDEFISGKSVTAFVNASAGGYLNGWCDFNADGDWDDASEQVFDDVPLVAGTNTLQINVPETAAVDTSYCRFRFSSAGLLDYDGEANDGEVEDYQVVISGETYQDFAIWHFNENQGSVAFDATPNHNNGTAYYTGWVPGFYGSALNFNGSSSYVTVPHSTSLDITGPFSVQAWIKCSGTANYYAIVDKYTYFASGSKGVTVYITSGKLRFGIYSGSQGSGDLFGTTDLRDNTFHHVFASWDGSFMRLFVDGKQQASAAWTHAPVSTTAPLGIGKRLSGWGGTMNFQGIIDEVKISDNPFPDRDFGDAPDPGFPSLMAHNGAFHLMNQGVFLGTKIDAEPDGLPNGLAKGDDNAGFDDEDGVTFASALIPGKQACIKITASVAGKLSAWMDFNQDNDWSDAGEQLFANENLVAGENNLSFLVPPDAVPGQTFSRFRFSTLNINGFVGFAPDGEVEDYAVEISSPIAEWLEGFEEYSAGSDIVGQGGWEFWGGATTSPNARVNDETSFEGAKSLKILGNANMSGDDIVHQFTGCDAGVWEISAWQYIPGVASGGKTYLILLNQYDCLGENLNWSTQIGFDPDLNLVESDFEGATAVLTKNLWVKISVIIDLDNNSQSIYYDGNHLVTKSWTEGVSGDGELNIAAIDLFSGTLENAFVYYDDISLSPLTTQIVEADEGWSGISSCLELANPNIESVMQPVISDLEIIYNLSGVYWPGQNLNTLDEWNKNSGYVMKLNNAGIIQFFGREISDKTLYLHSGWNLIPVFLDAEAASVLESLPGFKVAKGIATTEILWPAYNIHTLTNLATGKAYFVYTTQAGTITFAKGVGVSPLTKPGKEPINPWNDLIQTPNTHLVAFTKESLKDLKPGDWIGAFTGDGVCAGAVQISELSQPVAISMFGDDPTTAAKEGFAEGESIRFKTWRPISCESIDLEVTWDKLLNHSGLFETNALSVIVGLKTGSASVLSSSPSALSISPNPSKGLFVLSGLSGEVSLRIFNTLGKEIFRDSLILPAELNFSTYPKGVYFMSLKTGNEEFFEKLIIE